MAEETRGPDRDWESELSGEADTEGDDSRDGERGRRPGMVTGAEPPGDRGPARIGGAELAGGADHQTRCLASKLGGDPGGVGHTEARHLPGPAQLTHPPACWSWDTRGTQERFIFTADEAHVWGHGVPGYVCP